MKSGRVRWAALLAAGIAGCSLLVPHLERPTLSVVGVEVEDAQLTEQRFRVRIRVRNPNDRALPVNGLDFRMQLAGEELGYGGTTAAFTVPALGEAEFDTLVTTNLATTIFKILPRLKDASRPVDYRLVGKVSTSLGMLHSLPFDQTGTLPLRRPAP